MFLLVVAAARAGGRGRTKNKNRPGASRLHSRQLIALVDLRFHAPPRDRSTCAPLRTSRGPTGAAVLAGRPQRLEEAPGPTEALAPSAAPRLFT